MKKNILGALLPFSAILLTAACGGEVIGGPALASVPDDLAALVPPNTTLYIQLDSLDSLDESQALFTSEFGEQAAFRPVLDQMLGEVMDVDLIDTTRPIGVTIDLSSAMSGPPIVAFVVPVRDTDGFLGSLSGPDPSAAAVEGTYVGVPISPGYVRGEETSPLTDSLLAGDLSVRADLAAIIEVFDPMIQDGIEQMGMEFDDPQMTALAVGMEIAPILDLYVDGFQSFMDSAETLDLALEADGSQLGLRMAFTVAEGSELAEFAAGATSGVRDVAGYVDQDSAIVFLMGLDSGAMYDSMQPYMDTIFGIYPEVMRDSLMAYMDSYQEIMHLLDGGMAGSMDIQPGGMRFSYYMASDDTEAVIAKMTEMFNSDMLDFMGEASEPETLEIGGLTVMRSRIDFGNMVAALSTETEVDATELEAMNDMMATIYGPDGLQMAFAASDGVIAFIGGGDEDYLRKACANLERGPMELSADLERALSSVEGGRMSFVMRMDFARYMGGTIAMMSSMPGMPPAGSVPDLSGQSANILMHGVVDGLVWRGGVSVDLKEISDFASAMGDL